MNKGFADLCLTTWLPRLRKQRFESPYSKNNVKACFKSNAVTPKESWWPKRRSPADHKMVAHAVQRGAPAPGCGPFRLQPKLVLGSSGQLKSFESAAQPPCR